MDLTNYKRRLQSGENVRQVVSDLPDAALVELLGHVTSDVARRVLFDVAGERRVAAAVPRLIEGLAYATPSLRGASADALGKIGDKAAGRALLDTIAMEDDPGTRRAMLSALYTAGGAEAIPVLRTFLTHPDAGHRAFAARSLGGLVAIGAWPDLKAALGVEPNPFARQQLVEAMRALEQALPPVAQLVDELQDPRPSVRASAARQLAERDEVSALPDVKSACAIEYDPPTLNILRSALEHLVRLPKRG